MTSLVLFAAVICWINELLDDGPLGAVGIAVIALVLGWIWIQRTRTPEVSDRPFLVGGTAVLLLGIAFQVVPN